MYALEYDPTGTFGGQGSIYDLLADAKQKTARIAINAQLIWRRRVYRTLGRLTNCQR